MIKIFFAKELGFCWGVERSINLAAETKNGNSSNKVTILKEIVHNRQVVDFFRKKGVSQEYTHDKIESGTMVISAHGISPQLKEEAEEKGLTIVDTTCPLVEHVHTAARQLIDEGHQVILYGEPEHDEVLGVMGIAPDKIYLLAEYDDIDKLPKFEGKLALLSQTTRGVRAFDKVCEHMKQIYPDINIVNTICDATDKRQEAIEELAPKMDIVLVIGSETSGNSLRLRDIAKEICGTAYLLDSPDRIEESWFAGINNVGVTAGASTPSFSVEQILRNIHNRIGIDLENSDPKIFEYKTFKKKNNVQSKS